MALGGSSILTIYTYNYDNCLTKMPKIFFKESICFTKITFAFNGLSFVESEIKKTELRPFAMFLVRNRQQSDMKKFSYSVLFAYVT